MARAHFVAKAAKDNPVAKKGESYWWWKHMVGGRGGPKCYSKTKPRPSQLTQSEFGSRWLEIVERLEDLDPSSEDMASLGNTRDELVSVLNDLADETEGKLDNLPDGLRDGPTGELLQARADAAREWADNLEQVDLDGEPDGDEPGEDATDEAREKWADAVREFVEAALDELRNTDPGQPE